MTKKQCPACKGYGRVRPPGVDVGPDWLLCRKCGGSGHVRPKGEKPDYHASFPSLADGLTALICDSEEDARPWVNLLTGAGLQLEHLERAGCYTFRWTERPELLASKTPAELRPFYWLDDRPSQAEA